jgi:hypothetical protein
MWSGCLKWFWSETDDNLCSERRGPSPFPSHCCMNVTCINMSQRGYKKAGPQLCREASHNKFLHRQELCGVAWYSTDIYIYTHYIYIYVCVCMCQHMIKYIIYIWYISKCNMVYQQDPSYISHHALPPIPKRLNRNGSHGICAKLSRQRRRSWTNGSRVQVVDGKVTCLECGLIIHILCLMMFWAYIYILLVFDLCTLHKALFEQLISLW